MAKVGFGTFFGFLGSRRMVSGTKRGRFFIILSPVGNLTGSIFPAEINPEEPGGESWVWHTFWVFRPESSDPFTKWPEKKVRLGQF